MDILTLFFPLLLMVAGIALLIQGGNWTIDSAVYIARRFGLSPMVVGFTVLAFGTSLPELIVSILAVMRHAEGIAMGNVIGSNIANILMVIGAAAFFATMHVKISKGLIKDICMMLLSSALLAGLMIHGEIGRFAGVAMLLILALYVFLQYRMALKGEREVDSDAEDVQEFKNPYQPYLLLLLGLAGVAVGAEFLVRGASETAGIIGVPEDVIALSIIAFGTSLPELSTSIIGARKGHAEMALGNIIGSNVFNILLILGITAAVIPIAQDSYSAQLIDFDIWVMLGVSAVFAGLVLFYRKITAPIGWIFLGGYAAYTVYIYAINVGA